MNRMEHLLTIAGEEGLEVAHRASKALRFGLEEVQPGQDNSNWQRLIGELHDLLAVIELARDEARLPLEIDRALIDKKKVKVEKYLHFSRSLGTLQD